MIIRKICCIGADQVGGSFCSVVAFKCPEIEVYVVDQDEEKIMKWNSPQLPIVGNDLQEVVKKCLKRNLFFTSEVTQAIKDADIIFISDNSQLKTGGSSKGKTVNLKPLEDAARLIASVVVSPKIIVEKSTIPIRAAETIQSILKANAQPNAKFVVLSNPEFFTEETMMNDLLFPERILIGRDKNPGSEAAVEALIGIYEHWVPRNNIFTSDTWSTELAKLATNAFLAQRISSINSLSEVCEATNADVTEVAAAIGMDSRFGFKELTASIGFGGPSLRKDIVSIVYLCNSLNLPQVGTYWQKVLDMNEYQKKRFTNKVIQAFFNTLGGKYLAILGFSFKKNSKNTTDSPAIFVCKTLLHEGAKLKIYDPAVPKDQILKELMEKGELSKDDVEKSVVVAEDAYEAVGGTHGIIICTNWDQFLTLDYYKVYNEMMKPAYIFDGWKMLPHNELMEIGFIVRTIGKNLEQGTTPSKNN